MEDLSLHILDIVENAIRAKAKNVTITIVEDEVNDLLTLEIRDDGTGMDEEAQKRAIDPFFTTKKNKRVGLGLALLSQSASEAGGGLVLTSKKGEGTTVRATFNLSHIDRKPFGDIPKTLKCLEASHLDIAFSFLWNPRDKQE
jgi:signal transduction histidine kinase